MFRITRDTWLGTYYIHKKFLWWYVPFVFGRDRGIDGVHQTNVCSDPNGVLFIIEHGRKHFTFGNEYGRWWQMMDSGEYEQSYYSSSEDFKNKNPELFI